MRRARVIAFRKPLESGAGIPAPAAAIQIQTSTQVIDLEKVRHARMLKAALVTALALKYRFRPRGGTAA